MARARQRPDAPPDPSPPKRARVHVSSAERRFSARRRRSEGQLAAIFRDYGEERKWRLLAKRIVEERAEEPIRTTTRLADVCARVVGFPRPQRGAGGKKPLHPATRAFQALRIAVNEELAVVEEALPAAIASLAPGGRLAVISFHSLEDRIVKNIFRAAAGKARRGGASAGALRHAMGRGRARAHPPCWG